MIHGTVTLLEYAAARRLDPADLADATRHATLPEPAQLRDGQPAYDPAALDAALDVTPGTVTLAEHAARRGLTGNTARTVKAAGVAPVGERDGEPTFAGWELDRLFGYVPGLVTREEWAEEVGLKASTVKNAWPSKFAEVYPAPVAGVKRGRQALFRRSGLDRVRRRAQRLPDPQGAPEDLLDWEGVCAYLEPVTAAETMRWRRHAGVWPAGVVGSDGVERWARSEVERVQAGLADRQARGGR